MHSRCTLEHRLGRKYSTLSCSIFFFQKFRKKRTRLGMYSYNSNLTTMYQRANEDLNKIYDCFGENKLSINLTKTEYVLFRTPHSKPPPTNLSLSVSSINWAKCLGIAGLKVRDCGIAGFVQLRDCLIVASSKCGIFETRDYVNTALS